jgi:hypothetical protein
MNAVNGLTKVMVCGMAAVALTATSSLALLMSNQTVQFPVDMPTVYVIAKAETGKHAVVRLAQAN